MEGAAAARQRTAAALTSLPSIPQHAMELKQELKQSRKAGGAAAAAATPTAPQPATPTPARPAPAPASAQATKGKVIKPKPAAASPARPPKPLPASPDEPLSRKARRKERSKLLKVKKRAGRKRGRDSDDSDDASGPPPQRKAAAAPRGGLPQPVAAPLAATLKTRHWVEGNPKGGRLGAVFERQLADARARASGGVTADDRAAAIEAYRAAKGGNVGGATRTSLKALVAAGAARGVSAADGKKG